MLTTETLLQNRYRILRQIGGGGMGVVYLAEDTRLAGRRCAIKEMSPAQLAPGDRNWAIDAFRQEAQMLANLHHPGLTAVTDFFPEKSNWYLVMDYVEGETLKERLERTPGGCIPLNEALNIIQQLCKVLEYLHRQDPPVVFRDLKPGNVMLTPQGEVKLIDFGIARFFKPERTRDTVQLGTPGYAAPEQYGGLGQSDPRTDVYSLGALLLQMVTGYDPTSASTPFPLPSPAQLTRNLPPNVEQAISQATQMQPDLRYSTTAELRRALFEPTKVLPPSPSAAPGGKNRWIVLGIGGVLLIGLCAAVLGGALALPALLDGGADETPTDRPTTAPTTITDEPPNPSPTAQGTTPPTGTSPASPSPTRAQNSTPEPTADTSLGWSSIGQSAQGRDLEVAAIGERNGASVVVVGSIQGDQSNTRDLINSLIDDLNRERQRIPAGVAFHFIPTINPDGNAADTRRNARNVDLNRNWDTFDWTSDPEQPEGVVRGAGGSRPHSEPETESLASYLLALRRQNPDLRVVVWHASQRLSSGGHVYPGYTSSGLDGEALDLARRYAGVTGYTVKADWAPYETTGELITWCAEEGIEAIDIVIPRSASGSSTSLRNTTMEALLEVARYHE